MSAKSDGKSLTSPKVVEPKHSTKSSDYKDMLQIKNINHKKRKEEKKKRKEYQS